MTLFVYSIWIHQLEDKNYYAYCPQFPIYYSIATEKLFAYLRLNDVIISIIYQLLDEKIPLPESENFDAVPDNLLEGIQPSQVFLMPIEIVDGIQNTHSGRLIDISKKNSIIPMPIERIRLFKDVEEYYSNAPEYIGYKLPELELLQADELSIDIENITMKYSSNYKIGTEITGYENIIDFLKYICESTLSMIHDLIHQYSLNTILNYYIPQYDLINFFFGRESFEWKMSNYYFEFISDDYKQYFAYKRMQHSMLSLGHRFIINYAVAENSLGIKSDISAETFKQILRLAHLYVHSRGVENRVRQIKSIDKIIITSEGFAEHSEGYNYGWYYDFLSENVDDDMEIIDENNLHYQYYSDREDSEYLIAKREKKYKSLDEDLDSAFQTEFGVTFNQVKQFDAYLTAVRSYNNQTQIAVPRNQLHDTIKKYSQWSNETIDKLFQLFTLPKRNGWFDVPVGFDGRNELDPNNPFAELGIQKRPLIQVIGSNGEDLLLWGLRQRSLSFHYFLSRLSLGKFPAKTSKLLKWKSDFQNYEGQVFRDAVCMWFRHNLPKNQYKVELMEVELKKLFKDIGDLGDIDVAICDIEKSILYSVECKNITYPRTSADIRNELDRFGLIQGDNKYFTQLDWRHKNMVAHPEIMRKRLWFSKNPRIVSLIITSGITMTEHTGITKIPIFSFKDLQRGHNILNEALTHPYNTQK